MKTNKLTNAQARFVGKIAQLLVDHGATEFKALPNGIALPSKAAYGAWTIWMAYGRGEQVALSGAVLTSALVRLGETALDARWAIVGDRAEIEAINAFCGLVGRAVYLAEYGS